MAEMAGAADGGTIENRTFDEIAVGDTASLSRQLSIEDIELFAVMSGDINPAHLDEQYAKASMFQRLIGHGMWGGALISTVLGTRLPGPGTIYLSQDLRFRRPVGLGDTIAVTVTVREKIAEKGRVVFDCRCTNQAGEDVITGIAVMTHGYRVAYVPLNLAKGLCPDTFRATVNQQYRWCKSSLDLVYPPTRKNVIWQVFRGCKMTLAQRLSYLSGTLYYLQSMLVLIIAAVLAAGFTPAPFPPRRLKATLATMQGTWFVASCKADGDVVTGSCSNSEGLSVVRGAPIVITGNRAAVSTALVRAARS